MPKSEVPGGIHLKTYYGVPVTQMYISSGAEKYYMLRMDIDVYREVNNAGQPIFHIEFPDLDPIECEGLVTGDDGKDNILDFINSKYPDLHAMLNTNAGKYKDSMQHTVYVVDLNPQQHSPEGEKQTLRLFDKAIDTYRKQVEDFNEKFVCPSSSDETSNQDIRKVPRTAREEMIRNAEEMETPLDDTTLHGMAHFHQRLETEKRLYTARIDRTFGKDYSR